MREDLVQLRRELKFRIDRARFATPLATHIRLDVSVERCIDFDQIEIACQVLHRMLRLLQAFGIDDAFPVFVGPTRNTDVEFSQIQSPKKTIAIQNIPPGAFSFCTKQLPTANLLIDDCAAMRDKSGGSTSGCAFV